MAKKRKSSPKPELSSDEEEQQPKVQEHEAEEEEEEEDEEDEEEDEDEEEEEEEDEVESEGSKRESVRELLEPFGKDQLMDLLKEAAIQNPKIIERILTSAESDPIHRKIFIYGLGWEVTSETLISVFKKYGPIEECNVVMDKITGKSKGFGFLLFKTREATQKALKEPQKKIGNRMAACQLASSGAVPSHGVTNHAVPEATGRKIFVSNVGANVNPERLRAFFAKFGEIEEGPLGYDRVTGKLRGFAIFVYKIPEGCKKALEEPAKYFEGCQLQCQRALDGLKGNNKPAVGMAVGPVGGILQPNDLALTYASQSLMGLNPGLMGQTLNPAVGLLNPSLGTSLNQTGFSPSVGGGLAPSVHTNGLSSSPFGAGLGVGFGGQSGINSISPSVIGSYDSQAALQGLSVYQGAPMGQSSAAAAATRSQSGLGSIGSFPSYLGR